MKMRPGIPSTSLCFCNYNSSACIACSSSGFAEVKFCWQSYVRRALLGAKKAVRRWKAAALLKKGFVSPSSSSLLMLTCPRPWPCPAPAIYRLPWSLLPKPFFLSSESSYLPRRHSHPKNFADSNPNQDLLSFRNTFRSMPLSKIRSIFLLASL